MRRSILTEKLARRGRHITREYSIDPFDWMRVADVMDKEVPAVPATMKLAVLSDLIAAGDPALSRRQAVCLLGGQGELAGIITRGDIVRALRQNEEGDMPVSEAGSLQLVVAHPDEPLHDALARMMQHDVGRLPVVHPSEPSRLLGYLGRTAILSARKHQHDEELVRQKG